MLAAAARGLVSEGDWLRAGEQTGGKGRAGRVWHSVTGNLYASGIVALRPGDPPAPTLALVAALAVHDLVARYVDPARLMLKWPNDLLAANGKISGILLQRGGDTVVVGIGVNLAGHPVGLDQVATSVVALTGAAPDASAAMRDLAGRMTARLAQWREQGLASISADWLARAHAIGTPIVASLPDGERLSGVFDGLDDDCTLRLKLPGNVVRTISAGDVFLI